MVLIGIVAIGLVAVVNLWGIAESIKVNVVITCVEVTGLLFIVAVGAVVLARGDGNPGQAFEFSGSGFGVVTGLLAGAATAFYAFIGFEDSVNLAEETQDPSRNFPPALVTGLPALVTGLLVAVVLYLLVAFTAVMTVPLDVYGMAQRGILPAVFARLSTRRTPWFAIAVTTALSVVLLVAVDDLSDLADTTVLLLTAESLSRLTAQSADGRPAWMARTASMVSASAAALSFR